MNPSADMLDVARRIVAATGIFERVEFERGDTQAPTTVSRLHGTVCMLFVMRFIKGLDGKLRFLTAIRRATMPDSSLLLADLLVRDSENDRHALEPVGKLPGLPVRETRQKCEKLESDFHPLPRSEAAQVFDDPGFEMVGTYFQALRYSAFHLMAKPAS